MTLELETIPEAITLVGLVKDRAVYLNGDFLDPAESLLVWNKSPDGFNWGYGGSGPSQLALAILLEYMREDDALALFQSFKFKVIGALPMDKDFDVEIPLRDIIEEILIKKGLK